MKLYLFEGRYYEKQADVPSRKFETVEFPFAASPKADFVTWLNEREAPQERPQAVQAAVDRIEGQNDTLDQYVQREAERVEQRTVAKAREPRTADSVLEWMLDEATNAEVEQVFAALGARFHEASAEGRA